MRRPDRTEREAVALRANLLRRKEQMRRRAAAMKAEDAGQTGAEPAVPHPAAETADSDGSKG